jgi:hypothetical protein
MTKENDMNLKKTILIGFAMIALGGLAALGQTQAPDKVTVPLSNPAKPAVIEAHLMFGTLKVIGYEGKEVLVTATPREKPVGGTALGGTAAALLAGEAWRDAREAMRETERALAATPFRTVPVPDKEQAEKEKKAKTEGMKQIPLESSGITIEEKDNHVAIRLESWRRGYDIEVRVPSGSSLNLGGSSLEEIRVENVSGEVEINSAMGGLKLINVTGPVTASTTNGDIEAVLGRVAADKPMSFVTFNGDIDLTLPADTKAGFRIKSNMGQLYTDFDIALKTLPVEPERSTGREGAAFRVSLERSVFGTINGGGPEIKIQNFHGDIYLRKKK